jgi:hypothetical protein
VETGRPALAVWTLVQENVEADRTVLISATRRAALPNIAALMKTGPAPVGFRADYLTVPIQNENVPSAEVQPPG